MQTQTPSVLVVDDDPTVRFLVNFILRSAGLEVHLAGGGREAIDLYALYRETIALVLLDVQMPGLDGPQTLAVLGGYAPQVRCCFMMGNSGGYSTEQLLGLGAVRVFTKPFRSLAAFEEEVRQLACSPEFSA